MLSIFSFLSELPKKKMSTVSLDTFLQYISRDPETKKDEADSSDDDEESDYEDEDETNTTPKRYFTRDYVWLTTIPFLDIQTIVNHIKLHATPDETTYTTSKKGVHYNRDQIIEILSEKYVEDLWENQVQVLCKLCELGLKFQHLACFLPPYDWTRELEERSERRTLMEKHNQEFDMKFLIFKNDTNKQIPWFLCLKNPPQGTEEEVVTKWFTNCSYDESNSDIFYLVTTMTKHDEARNVKLVYWSIYFSQRPEVLFEHPLGRLHHQFNIPEDTREVGGCILENELTSMLFTVLRLSNPELDEKWRNHDTRMSRRAFVLRHLLLLSTEIYPLNVVKSEIPMHRCLSNVNEENVADNSSCWIIKPSKKGKLDVQLPLLYNNIEIEYDAKNQLKYILNVGKSSYSRGKFLYWDVWCNTKCTSVSHPLWLTIEQENKYNLERPYEYISNAGEVILDTPLTQLMLNCLSMSNQALYKFICNSNETSYDKNLLMLYRQAIIDHLTCLWD